MLRLKAGCRSTYRVVLEVIKTVHVRLADCAADSDGRRRVPEELQGGRVARCRQSGVIGKVRLAALFQRLPALCASNAARPWVIVFAAVRCLGRVGRKALAAVEHGFGGRHAAVGRGERAVHVFLWLADDRLPNILSHRPVACQLALAVDSVRHLEASSAPEPADRPEIAAIDAGGLVRLVVRVKYLHQGSRE